MRNNSKLIPACLAGVLMAVAMTPSVADEQFAPAAVVQLPDGQILSAFDISFVSPQNKTYALAASRVVANGEAFGTVIIVDTEFNVVTNELIPTGGFVGDCTVPPTRNTYSGPNGVIVIEKGENADVWAGDGPVFNMPCDPTSGLKTPSTVKVFDLHTGATKAVIQTGNGKPGTVGQRRADELCYNPVSDVVLIANDDPIDNFITFIGEDSYKVLQHIRFDGTDPRGYNLMANGIEQCAFNPRDGKFYINLPNTGLASATPPGAGVVLRISGEAPFHVEAIVSDFRIPPLSAASIGCGGASGLKVGPDHQIGLACGGANALIIDDRTGNPVSGGVLTNLGGADELWYNHGDNHYFFGISTPGVLGVADAGPPASVDGTFPSASGSHSVAADPRRNQVYVPIRGNKGTSPPTTPGATICSSVNDVFGNPGNDDLGCIAIYKAVKTQ
jgi:hypothetical protein